LFLVRRAAGVAKPYDVPRPDAFRVAALNRQDQQQFCSARSFFAFKKAGKIVVDLAQRCRGSVALLKARERTTDNFPVQILN
jgi:hypothetical protein